MADSDDSEPFIRIDQIEKSVELLYDKDAAANDELSRIEDFNGSPDHHRDEQNWNSSAHPGTRLGLLNESLELGQQELMQPVAGTGMNLDEQTKPAKKRARHDNAYNNEAENQGFETVHEDASALRAAMQVSNMDRNAESVNDVGLVASSIIGNRHDVLPAGPRNEGSAHKNIREYDGEGREVDAKAKHYGTAAGKRDSDKIFDDDQERAERHVRNSSMVDSFQIGSEEDEHLHLVKSFSRLQAFSKNGGNPHVSNILKNGQLQKSLQVTIQEQQQLYLRQQMAAIDPHHGDNEA